ncbi:MAG TPA: hypothetical protein VF720_15865, partial [Candidatus Eisenbacteria bacterium]
MTPQDKSGQKPNSNAHPETRDPEAIRSTAASSARSTISGPAEPAGATGGQDPLVDKFADSGKLAAAMPHNPTKDAEYGDAATDSPQGATAKPPSFKTTGSTLSEDE